MTIRLSSLREIIKENMENKFVEFNEGLLKRPFSYIRVDGKLLDISRCQADDALVFGDFQESLSLHCGHRLKQPVLLKEGEKELIEKSFGVFEEVCRVDVEEIPNEVYGPN